jgi:hypothetical protein
MSLPDRRLKAGKDSCTIPTATTKLTRVSKKDSLRNWPISCRRVAPMTLRTPTSLARLWDRAVARFMKLMQASRMMNRARAEKR